MYAKEECLIPAGMGKYIQVQTSCDIIDKVLVESSDQTIPGLVLPEATI